MNEPAGKAKRLTGAAKAAVDFGPLFVFLIVYFLGHRLASLAGAVSGRDFSFEQGRELYLAISAFLPAYAAAFIYSVWKERRIAPMLLVSGIVIGVLGSLTLVLQDKTFFYMKPTIVYALFAGTLAAGLATGRNFLRTLFDGALHLNDDAWRTFTKRYAVFFAALAIANEFAWRWLMRDCDLAGAAVCAGEPVWVNLKVFGFTGLNLLFVIVHAPFLARNMRPTGDAS